MAHISLGPVPTILSQAMGQIIMTAMPVGCTHKEGHDFRKMPRSAKCQRSIHKKLNKVNDALS